VLMSCLKRRAMSANFWSRNATDSPSSGTPVGGLMGTPLFRGVMQFCYPDGLPATLAGLFVSCERWR
jgi:hypothetical protein